MSTFSMEFDEDKAQEDVKRMAFLRGQGAIAKPQPKKHAKSPTSLPTTRAADSVIQTNFRAVTQEEEDRGTAIFEEGMKRFSNKLPKKSQGENIDTSESEMAADLEAAKEPVLFVPAWKTFNVAHAFVKNHLTETKANKILFLEPTPKLVETTVKRFMSQKLLAASKTISHPGQVHLGSRPAALCTGIFDAALLMKKLLTDPEGSPNPFANFACIFIERAHQMSTETQILLAVIKEVLRSKPPSTIPKIIVSVTTPQQPRLCEYFGEGLTKALSGASPQALPAMMNCHEAAGMANISRRNAANTENNNAPPISSVEIRTSNEDDKDTDAVKTAIGTLNMRFIKNACEHILAHLLLAVATRTFDERAAVGSKSETPVPIIVVYCDSKVPAFTKFEDKLAGFKRMAMATKGMTVKFMRTVEDVLKDGMSQANNTDLYVLVIGSAVNLEFLEELRGVAVAAVIDFGTTTVLSVDGDRDSKQMRKLAESMGGDVFASTLVLRNVIGLSPITSRCCDMASQGQIELRALSAAGALYIQLIPEEVVRPTAPSSTPDGGNDSINSRVAVSSSSLLPPIGSLLTSPRCLLSLLRFPVGSTDFLANVVYPIGSAFPLNLLKSLGMVSPNAPFVPTALGELVDHLPPSLTVEAGYIVLSMAALGLHELGAAIAAASACRLTQSCGKARLKFSQEHEGPGASLARASDLITDTLYFLTELDQCTFPTSSGRSKIGPLKPECSLSEFTDGDALRSAFGVFISILTSLGIRSDELGTRPTATKELIADLNEHSVVATAVISAAFAANAAVISNVGAIVPLHFKSGGRSFYINTIPSAQPSNWKPGVDSNNRSLVTSQPQTSHSMQVIVPASYSFAGTPHSPSFLNMNTMVPANLFFVSVVALRPVLELSLGDATGIFKFSVNDESHQYTTSRAGAAALLQTRMTFTLALESAMERIKQKNLSARSAHVAQQSMSEALRCLEDALSGDITVRDTTEEGEGYQDITFLFNPVSNAAEDVAAFSSALVEACAGLAGCFDMSRIGFGGLCPSTKNGKEKQQEEEEEKLKVAEEAEDDDGFDFHFNLTSGVRRESLDYADEEEDNYFAKHGPIQDDDD